MSDESISAATGLSLPWVRAIRAVESGGIPSAVRFEPRLFLRSRPDLASKIPYSGAADPLDHVAADTNRAAFEHARTLDADVAVRSSSWGSFQVLGAHLIEIAGPADLAVHAFDLAPADMSDRLLVHWIEANPKALAAAKAGDVDGWVLRYNGSAIGTPQHERYAGRMRRALAASTA